MGQANLVQFDPINQMILLTLIPLSGAYCSNLELVYRDTFDHINQQITLLKILLGAPTLYYLVVQWTPLNGITWGQAISDPINQMILLTLIPINQMILLTLIPLTK